MRVLLVSHGYPPEGWGGTERCVQALAHGLRDAGHAVGVLYRCQDPGREDHDVREHEREGVALFALNNCLRRFPGFQSYRDPHASRAAAGVFDRFGPDLVHVHHLHGLSTGLVFEARRRGAPVVMTLHDFWPACPLGQLLNVRKELCPGPTPRRCLGCVGGQVAFEPAAPGGSDAPGRAPSWALPLAGLASRVLPAAPRRVADRLRTMHAALQAADALVAPSRFLGARLAALGFPAVAHLPNPREAFRIVPRRAAERGTLRLGFVGACIASKGVHVLAEAIQRLRDPRVSLAIHGPFRPYPEDVAYRRRVAAVLREAPGGEAALRGPFDHARLPEILAELDALVVPSIWEENAPLSVEEAFAARLPVVASDHGGLRERIRDGVDGLLFRPGDAAELARALRRLLDEPDLRPNLCRDPPLAPDMDAHLVALGAVYDRARERHRQAPGRVGVVVVDHGRPDDTAAAVASAADPALEPAIVVVENGPGRPPALPGGAEVLALPENRGFAAGANAGFARLRARGCDRALVLNNDARLEPGALRRLAEALGDARLAAVGALLLRPDGRVESRGARFDTAFGRARLLGHGEPDRGAEGLAAAEGLSGAALMIRLAALDTVGGFDEQYFHAFEDADWCQRARRAGLGLAVELGARVRHAGGATLGASSPDRLYYAARNHLRAAQRLRPLGPAAGALRAAAIVAQSIAHALRQREVPRAAGVRAVLAGLRDFRHGRFGPRAA